MTVRYQRDLPMMDRPEGKEIIGSSTQSLNPLEHRVLSNLNEEKLSDLAESLFVLNNRHYGRIPGAYVVVCVKEGEQWCVGQLNVDRRKPIVMYEELMFSDPEAAQTAAEELKKLRGETTPCRCH